MTLFDATGRPSQALPPNAAQEAGGNLESVAAAVPTQTELMLMILKELRILNHLIAELAMIPSQDVQALRDDPSFP